MAKAQELLPIATLLSQVEATTPDGEKRRFTIFKVEGRTVLCCFALHSRRNRDKAFEAIVNLGNSVTKHLLVELPQHVSDQILGHDPGEQV
jgi:hypothetical protein